MPARELICIQNNWAFCSDLTQLFILLRSLGLELLGKPSASRARGQECKGTVPVPVRQCSPGKAAKHGAQLHLSDQAANLMPTRQHLIFPTMLINHMEFELGQGVHDYTAKVMHSPVKLEFQKELMSSHSTLCPRWIPDVLSIATG